MNIKTNTEIKYPIGGYAPGSYMCKCSECGEKFIGDKRSTQCEPCAINIMNKDYKFVSKELKILKDHLRKLETIYAGIKEILATKN